jgi:hypothetical protein
VAVASALGPIVLFARVPARIVSAVPAQVPHAIHLEGPRVVVAVAAR